MIVICPSRGRPGNIVELLDCWRDTRAEAELVVCVDDDDQYLTEYQSLEIRLKTGPRQSLGGWLNRLAWEAEYYKIVGFIGDDVRPRTMAWDKAIASSMRPYGVVYGNDLHQGGRLATHPFISAEIIKRLGFIAPPGVDHLYLDNFWHEVGRHLGTLVYREDVVLEHLHPHAGKAAMDEGYERVNSREAYVNGRAAFVSYMESRFHLDMRRVTGDG